MKKTKNLMKAKEFVDEGFLQEANRQFFHPLGLQLCAVTKKGDESLDSGELVVCIVMDFRNESEKAIFTEESISSGEITIKKMDKINGLLDLTHIRREEKLGFWMQDIES